MTGFAPHRPRLALAVAAAALLAGCGPTPTAMLRPTPTGPAAVNIVEAETRTETLAFAGDETVLQGAGLGAFRSRFSAGALGRGHHVTVSPATPGDRLSELRAAWTASELRRQGVMAELSVDAAGSPAAGTGADGVILEITRQQVAPLDCRRYPRAVLAEFDPTMTDPLGCANTANLGRMVAEPADLLGGRSLGPGDASTDVKAVETHRAGKSANEGGKNPIAEAFANAFGGKDK